MSAIPPDFYECGDHRDLLNAIRKNPEEDLPRLAYADLVQEWDCEERAHLIRLQCEYERARCKACLFASRGSLSQREATIEKACECSPQAEKIQREIPKLIKLGMKSGWFDFPGHKVGKYGISSGETMFYWRNGTDLLQGDDRTDAAIGILSRGFIENLRVRSFVEWVHIFSERSRERLPLQKVILLNGGPEIFVGPKLDDTDPIDPKIKISSRMCRLTVLGRHLSEWKIPFLSQCEVAIERIQNTCLQNEWPEVGKWEILPRDETEELIPKHSFNAARNNRLDPPRAD